MPTKKAETPTPEMPPVPAVEPKKVDHENLPEVRQCDDPDSDNYGAVAVKSQLPIAEWFVGRPGGRGAGGHWGEDNEVEGWTTLTVNPK